MYRFSISNTRSSRSATQWFSVIIDADSSPSQ